MEQQESIEQTAQIQEQSVKDSKRSKMDATSVQAVGIVVWGRLHLLLISQMVVWKFSDF